MEKHEPASLLSSIGTNEIKLLSIIFTQLLLLIFIFLPPDVQLLQGEVIPATRHRRFRLIGTLHLARQVSHALLWTSKTRSLGIIRNTFLFVLKNQC
jgi:hypothetical protein